MPILLRRLAAAVSAPLRRSLCTARSRPPWAMVNVEVALDASAGAPSPGARACFDLKAAPRASQLSVPARFIDPRGDAVDFLLGIVRGASSDGLLLLDFLDTRHCPRSLHELAAEGSLEQDVRLFVCNPLSGQLLRLPVPEDVTNGSTPFGLLTQSEGSHGPPDRYVVAQFSCQEGGNNKVVRRFLSETGQWEDRPLVVARPPTTQAERRMLLNREVLAFGDRLWWVDVTWGVCSVDPFSDRPELRFVELPDCSVLPAPPCVDGLAGSLIMSRPWVAAIDPFNANVVYLQHRAAAIAVDLAKAEVISRTTRPDKITCQMVRHSSLFHPCVLTSWLASSYIPGTLSSKKTNCERKTLAEMLVRVDKGHKN
ncbi:unnamed protein product [Alopecurus aequalis]